MYACLMPNGTPYFSIASSLRNLNPSLFKLRHSSQNNDIDNSNNNSGELTDEQRLDLVLSASVHLVSIDAGRHVEGDAPGQYKGITGEFCRLNWAAHKESPSATPMFRDLVAKSSDCQDNAFRLDLASVVAAAKRRDAEVKRDATLTAGDGEEIVDGIDAALLAVPRAMYPPRGVVFHESRCGSTLVANALAAFDPERSRVYSESAPPIAALRVCGEDYSRCGRATAAAVLRDVMYLMSRTDDPAEEHTFFKIQSIGTRFIEVFAEAFPTTPYLFVYRDPVQVMMSHLDHEHMEQSNCVRPRSNPPRIVVDLVEGRAGRSVTDLSHEEYCAAHLATLCDSALAEMERGDNGLGLPVNYKDLPEKLYEVIPNHFGVAIGDDETNRIAEVSGVYSKGRGNRAHEWKDDSETKEERATDAIRGACSLFLDETFRELERRAASVSASAGRGFAEETR